MGETPASLYRDPAAPPSERPRRTMAVEVAGDAGSTTLLWHLRRNCSATPRQMLSFYASVCLLSTVLASLSWIVGASLVAPFAVLELLAVGAALWVYARHATDQERIVLDPGRLSVEQIDAGRVARVEFSVARVRVAAPERGSRLVELSGEGRRVCVGRFLRADQRRLLVTELRAALRATFAAGSPNGLRPHPGATST